MAPARKLSIHDTRIAGLYDLEHTIGKGHFAVVKLAKHVFTGEKVAVKVIDKSKLDPVSQAHMMQEVRCMKLVQHPNIVRLYEVIDTSTKLFLILELGDYDMYDYIMKNEHRGIVEGDAQMYFSQIIKAIDYCHTLHVVHRDLKPENVVFFEKLGMVKLTDFGFSNHFTPGQQLQTSCGSLAYSAPEILLGDAYDAPAVDVWSLGVILYMLVCGRLPFQETNESETLTKILDCRYVVPDYISSSCKELIARMLVRDPTKRATLSEIAQFPWVVSGDRGHAEVLPLIMKDQLPVSAHATIIEQMVAGGIASEEEVLNAIENDDYNYITATYYLLAERVLASYREEQANRLLLAGTSKEADDVLEGTDGASTSASAPVGFRSRSRSNSWRGSTNNRRACTILKEESEEELSSYLRSSSRQSSRNSSPSVSMFVGGGGLHSSRDRISPQAIHDLLEFSRITSGMKRAASPDSRISSRSPSPTSSGRTSPAISTSLLRLKVSAPTMSGGMRKLSSSPHLLGIYEESEDGSTENQPTFYTTPRSVSTIPSQKGPHLARGNRSASIGLGSCFSSNVHPPSSSTHGKVSSNAKPTSSPMQADESGAAESHSTTSPSVSASNATYSSVRVIRPRQAVVSPDMARRYDQHQRFIGRSRRSTSCSSSETSDDDSNERKLSLIGSKYCKRNSDDRNNEDDGFGGGTGGGGGPHRSNSMKEQTIPEEPSASTAPPEGDKTAVKGCAARDTQVYRCDALLTPESPCSCWSLHSGSDCSVFSRQLSMPLQPIMEHDTLLSTDDTNKASTAQDALIDWLQESTSYWSESPPIAALEENSLRDHEVMEEEASKDQLFYRTLRRSKSLDTLKTPFLENGSLGFEEAYHSLPSPTSIGKDSIDSTSTSDSLVSTMESSTDSGCSSDEDRRFHFSVHSFLSRPKLWFTKLTKVGSRQHSFTGELVGGVR